MNLAYLTTCFGTPSHTFIRRELRAFASRGMDVKLFGIRKDTHVADDAVDLVERTEYLYPVPWAKTIALNIFYSLFYAQRYWPAFFSALFAKHETLPARLKLIYHLVLSVHHARALEKAQISHLHVHFLNVAASVSMFASRLTKIPYSLTIHSAGEKNLPHVVGIPLKLKYAQSLLMISKFNIDYYDAIYPCRDKSHVVRCGMDLDNFHLRDFVPFSKGETLRILAIGRFVEKKGFSTLIEACALLHNQGFDFQLEILGSGPLHETLKSHTDTLGLNAQIKLPGQATTEQVKQKMKDTHVVVVPSVTSKTGEMEGIPVVIMEAMASGVPVIATEHSGIPELVNSSTGSLVPERDAEALAQAIAHFETTEEKISTAQQLIQSEFNIGHVVDQRQQLFEASL